MTAHRARLLRRGVLMVNLLLAAVGLAIQLFGGPVQAADLAFGLLFAFMVIGLGVIGFLIAARQPGNLVGWLFLACSFGIGFGSFSFDYLALSQNRFDLTLPGTVFLAWLSSWVMIPSLIALVIFVPLLFPTGHLPTRRWRPVAWLGIAGIVFVSLGSALVPGPLQNVGVTIDNPVGVTVPHPIIDIIGAIDGLSGVTLFGLTLAAVVTRYRHGSPLERLQLRWFAYPAAIAIVCIGAGGVVNFGPLGDVAWAVGLGSLGILPVFVGVAILRHRLFDIDLVIKRTISYGVLTVLLLGLEIGGVLLLQTVLSNVTQEQTYAVAATTLGVAALFRPARRRIQGWVDRRFDRSRYDAARVVDGFGARLRDQLDLDEVVDELADAARVALLPVSASVWIRQPGGVRQ